MSITTEIIDSKVVARPLLSSPLGCPGVLTSAGLLQEMVGGRVVSEKAGLFYESLTTCSLDINGIAYSLWFQDLTHVLAGYKATLSNANSSEDAKQVSRNTPETVDTWSFAF